MRPALQLQQQASKQARSKQASKQALQPERLSPSRERQRETHFQKPSSNVKPLDSQFINKFLITKEAPAKKHVRSPRQASTLTTATPRLVTNHLEIVWYSLCSGKSVKHPRELSLIHI